MTSDDGFLSECPPSHSPEEKYSEDSKDNVYHHKVSWNCCVKLLVLHRVCGREGTVGCMYEV